LFKEGKKKLALLSLLSALAVASTASVGVSIYAMTADDGEKTTLEEKATTTDKKFKDSMNHDNKDAASSDDNESEDDDDGSKTTVADVKSLLDGLVVCDVGEAEISGETQTASSSLGEMARTKPTVSVSVMSETEIAALADSEREKEASEDDGTSSTAPSADCVRVGEDKADKKSTSANSEASSSAAEEDSDTTSTSALDSDRPILVIEGQGFAPGQVVLMFIDSGLRGIDDVDDDGEIESKIPVPENSKDAITGKGDPLEIRLVESGTQRTANLEFDGETLTAHANSDIKVDNDKESSSSDDK